MADRNWSNDISRLSDAINNLQKSLACTICLELMVEPNKTRCGHSYCKSCIGNVLRKNNACCPLCKENLNRRNISKDDHLQICIEKFQALVTAIQIDSNIDILSYSKQPHDTKESYSYPDAGQSISSNKEKLSKKEKSICQNVNKQIDKPSTSHEAMTDHDNSQYNLHMSNEFKTVSSTNLCAHDFSGDKNVSAIHSSQDIKVRTWLYFSDKPSTDDCITKNEIPIGDKARPTNPISDDNDKSDEAGEVYGEIEASRRSSQDRKRSTDCPKRIDKDDTLSQVNKGARQIGEVIEIDSATRGLKYNASHARIRAKKIREEIAKSDIEEAVNQDNSSSTTAYDRTAASTSSLTTSATNASAIAEQSTANWSRVIEVGKEMKRTRKRKVKKLNVSTEKNKNPPRIVENIKLSPNSKYDSATIATMYNKSEKEANISNRSNSDNRNQNAIDESLDSSDAEVKSLSKTKGQTKLCDKPKIDSSRSIQSMLNTSYITLEEGRQIHIMNLNNNEIRKIIGSENAAKDSQYSLEEDSSQKRLAILTPDKLNESLHEIIRDVSQTSASNFRSSSCLPAEKRTFRPQGTSNVQKTSSGATSPKARLSLRRKRGIDGNKGDDIDDTDDSPLSQLPLSYRLSTDKQENVGNRKSVDSSVPTVHGELFDRFKVVRRDLNFELTREDQQRTDRDTVSANTRLEGIIEVENNDGNVSGIVRQDRKFSHNFTGKSTTSKKFIPTKSKIKNPPFVKFMQLGSLLKRCNVKNLFLGSVKREFSMPAEVRINPVYNMQQSISRSELQAISFNPWDDLQNSSYVFMMENTYSVNDSNSKAVPKAFRAELPICKASTISMPKKGVDSHLNQEKNTTIVCSSSANQRSDKSIKNVAEESEESSHKSRMDKSAIHRTISHTRPGPSNSIKLLSPEKDSQLKFLQIDSPISESEKLKRASSTKSAIKGNNFLGMESSRLAASTVDKARKPSIEDSYKKRKRMRCASDRESFENASDDKKDDSSDSVSDSSRCTIKLDRYSKLSMKEKSSLDLNKKRRLSSPDDEDIDVISVFKKQDTPKKNFMSGLDTEPEGTYVTKNFKRYNVDQSQRNVSITDMATKKYSARQDSDEDHRIRVIDKWSSEHDITRKGLTKEGKTSQNSAKSMKSSLKEDSLDHQSSRSNNTLKIEKCKDTKSSEKNSAKGSDLFESSSLFNSENMDYILQQEVKLNTDDTSKKNVDSSNDDIINKVLQIDRSRNNPGAYRLPGSVPRNDITNQKEKDSNEYLLQDNFDDIIANIEQPQSEDLIPCTEQSDHNPNRPLAKQKTLNCPAMTDESYGLMRETPILPPSSTHDMFEYSPIRNVRKSPTTNAISRSSDKENVAYSQKKHSYIGDQRGKKDAANIDAIDKDSHKKIVSKHNVSRQKEKFLEEHNASIQSANRLHIDDGEMQRTTIPGNRSKNDTFEHDSLMNITQHEVQLQMFEEDLFGTAARNQAKAIKMTSQQNLFPKEQRTPKKRKQDSQDKNTELEERFADEDDVVENTPEKKIKSNKVKTIESRESTKITPIISPISKISEQTPNTSRPNQTARFSLSSKNTPIKLFDMCPSSQSTPIIPQNVIISRSASFGGSKRIERVESGNILLAKQVSTKTLENVHRQPDKRDLCFVCTGLSMAQISIVKEFAAKYNANYVNQFDHDVTHVIVKTVGEQNAANSTLKYLQGIAHQKWVVSYRWIEDCMKQKKLLDEIPYEATTQNDVGINGAGPRNSRLREKGLFEGFTFLCVGPYNNVSLSQYEDLLLATGAKVVDSFDVFAKLDRYMKGIVIQDNSHDDKIIEGWYRTAKAGPILVDWIVECIGQYKLFKLTPYIPCLSPQDFCAIGYPRELVEEDEDNDNE